MQQIWNIEIPETACADRERQHFVTSLSRWLDTVLAAVGLRAAMAMR